MINYVKDVLTKQRTTIDMTMVGGSEDVKDPVTQLIE